MSSDSTNQRTLGVPVNIPGGVTAESCTAACQSLGGYLNAGIEIGHECCESSPVTNPLSRSRLKQRPQGVTTLSMHLPNVYRTMIVGWSVRPTVRNTAAIRIVLPSTASLRQACQRGHSLASPPMSPTSHSSPHIGTRRTQARPL